MGDDELWRELRRARFARWRAKNKDKIRAYRKEWLEKNPDYIRKWREKNREKINAYQRKYREENRDYMLIQERNRYRLKKQRCKE